MTGALDGLRVVDFGQGLAAPLVAMILGDNGADVIRVDPPGGPRWDHPSNAVLQRSKRSIALDLKTPDDIRIARCSRRTGRCPRRGLPPRSDGPIRAGADRDLPNELPSRVLLAPGVRGDRSPCRSRRLGGDHRRGDGALLGDGSGPGRADLLRPPARFELCELRRCEQHPGRAHRAASQRRRPGDRGASLQRHVRGVWRHVPEASGSAEAPVSRGN